VKPFNLEFAVSIPVSRPNTEYLPPAVLQDLLADAVAISGDGVGMIGGTIAFDTTEVLAGLIGMNHADVDEEALDADLIVKLVA
jgi:hypothetical protein